MHLTARKCILSCQILNDIYGCHIIASTKAKEVINMAALFSKKSLNKKRIIIKVSELAAFLAIVFLAITLFRTHIITDYKGREVTGPYKVAEANAILIDKSRVEEFEDDGSFREVPVHFFICFFM